MRILAPKSLDPCDFYVGIVETGGSWWREGAGGCTIASALKDKAQRVPPVTITIHEESRQS